MKKVFWLTGLSGAGKTTLAGELSGYLASLRINAFTLDGDMLRSQINVDLGFNSVDRRENVRRVAHIARLMSQAGIVPIVALISPAIDDREMAKEIIGADNFLEVYIRSQVFECASRDIKGLYAKAIAGDIKEFTGISMDYESPVFPNLIIDTTLNSVIESKKILFSFANNFI